MPSHEGHLDKERANAAFEVVAREQGNSVEWSVVVLFYRAVHLVEAYFALDGTHHRSHTARLSAVRRRLADLEAMYVSLSDLSRLARYEDLELVTWADYAAAREDFVAIEQYLRPRIETTQ